MGLRPTHGDESWIGAGGTIKSSEDDKGGLYSG